MSTDSTPAPRTGNHLEDMVVGERTELGSHTFTAAEIKAFAAKYDPQPFHMDEAAAKDSMFGALCASGWHTASVCLGMLIRHRQAELAVLKATGVELAYWGPSPGFKDLKWPKPVFVGDTIAYRSTIEAKIDLKSRPERGLLTFRNEGHNQNGEPVFSVLGQILVPRRVPLQVG